MLAKMGGDGYQPITVSTDEIAGIDKHSADHHGDIDLSGAVFVRPSHTNPFCPAQKSIVDKEINVSNCAVDHECKSTQRSRTGSH